MDSFLEDIYFVANIIGFTVMAFLCVGVLYLGYLVCWEAEPGGHTVMYWLLSDGWEAARRRLLRFKRQAWQVGVALASFVIKAARVAPLRLQMWVHVFIMDLHEHGKPVLLCLGMSTAISLVLLVSFTPTLIMIAKIIIFAMITIPVACIWRGRHVYVRSTRTTRWAQDLDKHCAQVNPILFSLGIVSMKNNLTR